MCMEGWVSAQTELAETGEDRIMEMIQTTHTELIKNLERSRDRRETSEH